MTDDNEITAKFLVDDLQSAWDENAVPSTTFAHLLIGVRTDLGCVRENNEDKFEFYIPSTAEKVAAKGCLVAVADGMGGHAAGQIASELGLKTFVRSYMEDTHADVPGALRMAVSEGNRAVHDAASISGRNGMGTTLTAAVVRGTELYVAQVGDSRLYLMQDGTLEQVSRDHSWVAEQVERGVLTEQEAETSPFRNVITRSLGTNPEVEPDIFTRMVKEGDTLLLCSDGLSGVVGRGEMERVLSESGPAESCQELVEMALRRGGPDNTTVLIAQIQQIDRLSGEEEPGVEQPAPQMPEQEPALKPKRRRLLPWFSGRK